MMALKRILRTALRRFPRLERRVRQARARQTLSSSAVKPPDYGLTPPFADFLEVRAWAKEVRNPRVAIVVTCHNDSFFLRDCLTSIQRQDFEDFEVVIVDDYSIDTSPQIAAEYAAKDSRFRLVLSKENVGLANARNIGLLNSSSPLITFLDADDLLIPDSLSARVTAAEQAVTQGNHGSFCEWISIEFSDRPNKSLAASANRPDVSLANFDGRNPIIASSPIYERDTVLSLGGFNGGFETAEDFEFISRFIRAGYALVHCPTHGVAYRQKPYSMSASDPLGHFRHAAAVLNWWQNPLSPDEFTQKTVYRDAVPVQVALLERIITGIAFMVSVNRMSADTTAAFGKYFDPTFLPLVNVDALVEGAFRRTAKRSQFQKDSLTFERTLASVKRVIERLSFESEEGQIHRKDNRLEDVEDIRLRRNLEMMPCVMDGSFTELENDLVNEEKAIATLITGHSSATLRILRSDLILIRSSISLSIEAAADISLIGKCFSLPVLAGPNLLGDLDMLFIGIGGNCLPIQGYREEFWIEIERRLRETPISVNAVVVGPYVRREELDRLDALATRFPERFLVTRYVAGPRDEEFRRDQRSSEPAGKYWSNFPALKLEISTDEALMLIENGTSNGSYRVKLPGDWAAVLTPHASSIDVTHEVVLV